MALQGTGRFVSYEKSRNMIYVSSKVAEDSNFPFRPGDDLTITIDAKSKRLIVEKSK
jgi:hypothetical protein